MIEIVNGRVFVEGKETVDPTLIGYALLDFAESQENDGMKIVLKDQDVFVQSLITEL
jgi:hypothetical protein